MKCKYQRNKESTYLKGEIEFSKTTWLKENLYQKIRIDVVTRDGHSMQSVKYHEGGGLQKVIFLVVLSQRFDEFS